MLQAFVNTCVGISGCSQPRIEEGSKKMLELIRRIRKCDQGATAVEYGLIVSLIVIAIAASIGNLGNGTQVMWNSVSEKVLESSS
jgi:pilus assembly protein Flp/PilA